MSSQIREIRKIDLVTYAIIPPIVIILTWTLFLFLVKLIGWPMWIFYVLFGILTYFSTRRFAIGLVLVYKAFAPLDVRRSCRFVPTCSTYMIMAIKKYGLIYGIIKGIRRLLRCKPPNGGEDYP